MIDRKELLSKISDIGISFEIINDTIKVPVLKSAYIKFSEPKGIAGYFERKRRFSHIDLLEHKNHEGIVVSAGSVCIDEKFGSVFGVSATRTGITLIPQHRTNLESFVDYYLMIVEQLDHLAVLMRFSEYCDEHLKYAKINDSKKRLLDFPKECRDKQNEEKIE